MKGSAEGLILNWDAGDGACEFGAGFRFEGVFGVLEVLEVLWMVWDLRGFWIS